MSNCGIGYPFLTPYLTFAQKSNMNLKPLNRFWQIALLEGVSYIVLLFIAMPVKYLLDIPELVTFVGWAHGVLFVAYIALLISAAVAYDWKIGRIALLFIGSLVPFAPFFMEKKMKKMAIEEIERKLNLK